MRPFSRICLVLLVVVSVMAAVIATASRSRSALAQEEAERAERQAAAEQAELLERQLNDIEKQLKQAQEAGAEDRVRELRGQAEQILDRLEALERARPEGEGEEGEEAAERDERARELEFHRRELEIERLHLELQAARLEAAVRLAHIAHEKSTSDAYALAQALEGLEEEGAVEFLMELREQAQAAETRRLIGHHLATVYRHLDRPDEARRVLRDLILKE